MTWKADPASQVEFGPFTVVSERNGSQTAYLVSFGDGSKIRVLPDDAHTAQKRGRVVKSTAERLAAAWATLGGHTEPPIDPDAYLVGVLTLERMTWERVPAEVEASDILASWFRIHKNSAWLSASQQAASLHRHLTDHGWDLYQTIKVDR